MTGERTLSELLRRWLTTLVGGKGGELAESVSSNERLVGDVLRSVEGVENRAAHSAEGLPGDALKTPVVEQNRRAGLLEPGQQEQGYSIQEFGHQLEVMLERPLEKDEWEILETGCIGGARVFSGGKYRLPGQRPPMHVAFGHPEECRMLGPDEQALNRAESADRHAAYCRKVLNVFESDQGRAIKIPASDLNTLVHAVRADLVSTEQAAREAWSKLDPGLVAEMQSKREEAQLECARLAYGRTEDIRQHLVATLRRGPEDVGEFLRLVHENPQLARVSAELPSLLPAGNPESRSMPDIFSMRCRSPDPTRLRPNGDTWQVFMSPSDLRLTVTTRPGDTNFDYAVLIDKQWWNANHGRGGWEAYQPVGPVRFYPNTIEDFAKGDDFNRTFFSIVIRPSG